MKEETPKCNSCGQPMFEIGGIGKDEQLMEQYPIETKMPDGKTVFSYGMKQVGIREQKLYQCPECKDVKIY